MTVNVAGNDIYVRYYYRTYVFLYLCVYTRSTMRMHFMLDLQRSQCDTRVRTQLDTVPSATNGKTILEF